MPRATPIVNSFAGGEISPHLDARADLQWYYSSCRRLENMIPRAQGGALRRGGTRFIAEVKDSAARTALIPFEFSTRQAYVIEAGDGYFRFFKDKGRIEAPAIATAISNGDFVASLADWGDKSSGGGSSAHASVAGNGRLRLTPGGTGAINIGAAEQAVAVAADDRTKEHVLAFHVIGAAGDTVLLNVGTTSGGGELIADRECPAGWHLVAFTPGSGAATVYVRFKNKGDANNPHADQNKAIDVDDVAFRANGPIEIATPWTSSALFDTDGRLSLKFTQSADVLYLVHPDVAPCKLSRTGHTSWSLTEIAFADGPYFDENTTATTLVASAGTGAAVTITASSAAGLNAGGGFKASDLGRLIRLKNGANWSWGVIVGISDATHATADIRGGTAPTTATAAWQIGLWSTPDSVGGGWPSCVMFFEERLMFGGAAARPNRWDASASGDFETFTPDTDDAAAVAFTIASDQVNAIRWMAPANKLILGTLGAEFAAGGSGSIDASITPTNVNVRLQTRHGVADVAPALVGSNSILFVQRQGRKLREIAFSFEADGYVSEDMTVRAEHITRGGLLQLAWQQEPFGILWAVRADGRLLGFTYLRSQQVTAWHQHPLADSAAAEAIATIPGNGDDQLWLVARRTIGGETRRHIEVLEPPLADEADPITAFYVDSGLTYDGKVATALTPGNGATTKGQEGVVFTASAPLFSEGDVNREIRYRVPGDPGANPPVEAIEARAVIKGYVSPTAVTAKILGAFPSLATIPANAWRLSVSSVAGLDHLDGKTVQIVTDGAVHPPKVVSGGAVTLAYPATVVHVGLGYVSTLLPVKFEAGATEGTAQGKKKRVSKVTLRLHRTLGCKVGRPGSSPGGAALLDELPFRDYGGLMDAPPPLFTGDKEITFRGNYDTAGDVLVVQDQPLPLAVLAAMPVLATSEGG